MPELRGRSGFQGSGIPSDWLILTSFVRLDEKCDMAAVRHLSTSGKDGVVSPFIVLSSLVAILKDQVERMKQIGAAAIELTIEKLQVGGRRSINERNNFCCVCPDVFFHFLSPRFSLSFSLAVFGAVLQLTVRLEEAIDVLNVQQRLIEKSSLFWCEIQFLRDIL